MLGKPDTLFLLVCRSYPLFLLLTPFLLGHFLFAFQKFFPILSSSYGIFYAKDEVTQRREEENSQDRNRKDGDEAPRSQPPPPAEEQASEALEPHHHGGLNQRLKYSSARPKPVIPTTY